jgi:phage gp29-like protein
MRYFWRMTADEKRGIVAPLPANYRTNDFDLANVTPDQVRNILRNVRTGKLEDQDRLFRLMLDTWPRLRKALNEIAGAVAALELEIKPAIREDAEEPTPSALRIYEVVKRALESFAPKPQAWELDGQGGIRALIDAYAKGISVLEIVWHNENGIISPRCYCPVPAKYLAYPQSSSEIDRLMIAPEGVNNSTLVDFPADKFLIAIWQQGGMHPIHAANLRALTKYWLGSVYGLGWLMQFAQLFGIPWRHIETDGSDEAMTKAEELLETIGSSGAAVTGPGVKLTILDGVSGSADSLPQSHLMDIADRACDILLLGQTLTTDNTGTGSRALGEVHGGIRKEYIQSVANWVSGIITTQLIPSIVRWNFGKVASEDMPYAEIRLPEVKDQKAITERVEKVISIGVPVTKQWVYDELGIPMPNEGEELFTTESELPALPPEINENQTIDLMPTADMAEAANNALEAKRAMATNERGMGAVCMARARDIVGRTSLTVSAVKGMADFFQRCESANRSEWKQGGKKWQEWHSMGGDAGREWALSKLKELNE